MTQTFNEVLQEWYDTRRIIDGMWELDASTKRDFAGRIARGCGRNFEARRTLPMGSEAIPIVVFDDYLKVLRVLKIPRPDLPDVVKKRFIRGLRIQSQIGNGHFPKVLYLSASPLFAVLEWVPGRTLREWAFSDEYCREAAIEFFREILMGMSRLHDAEDEPVTHRDIRPDNIVISNHNQVKIIDFGMSKTSGSAKLTALERPLGNEFYSPPEQLVDAAAVFEPNADVYSLAQTFYFMATHREEKTGGHDPTIFVRHDLPDTVVDWYAKAIAEKPEDRYQSASEMLGEYNRIFPPPLPTHVKSEGQSIYDLVEDLLIILSGDLYYAEIFTSSFLSSRQLRRLIAAVSERRAKNCTLE